MITGELKQFGFDPSRVIIKPEAWKFGSNIPLKELNPGGQWDKWLPQYEAQAEFYETYGCTIWGTQNQIETLLNFLYEFKEEPNYAEQYNYNNVGIEPPGSDPDLACEDVRENGLVRQSLMPLPGTLQEFKSPRPMTPLWLREGKKWLDEFSFSHEWVRSNDPTKMKELIVSALNYSPIAISVTAWFKDENGLYVDNGQPNTHWCLAYGWRKDEQGRVILKIFDSYDHSHKELHPDHRVMFAKRISISVSNKTSTTDPGGVIINWWKKFLAFLLQEINILRYFRRSQNK